VDVFTSGQEGSTVWRSPIIHADYLGVFAGWPVDGVHDQWSREGDLRATVPKHWRDLPDLNSCNVSALVTGRKGTFFAQPPNRFSSVSVTTQPTFAFGNPRPATSATFLMTSAPPTPRSYDITPDGTRFIQSLRQIQTGAGASQIQVVLSWFTELQQRVPTR
jgi:hypothetical protein